MGINQKNAEWGHVVGEWREKQKCKKSTKVPCCEYHDFMLHGEKFENSGNIITTPAAEEFLKKIIPPKGLDGKAMVSTARGKRRMLRREGKK